MGPDLSPRSIDRVSISHLGACRNVGCHSLISIIDRILPRLSHINPAIVFSAMRTIISFMHLLTQPLREALAPKLNYPISRPKSPESLLNSYSEVAFILLKYLQSVVLVYPLILGENYSDYICSYSDPMYIRLEKMEIMYRMANEKNAKNIMNEFYEYHKDQNSDYVKISIDYIAKICLRINSETPYGIELYVKILENLPERLGADYLDTITIAAVKIMRVFPKVKGGTQIVKLIAARFKDLFSTEAKSSFIWLIGEYCKRIDNAGQILEHFTKTYFTQPPEVQLRILSSGVKMYLFQIEPIDSVMTDLIQSISDKSTNADLRDRAYIYWRLLYKDDEKAKDIIFNEQQAVEVDVSFTADQIEEAKRLLKLGGKVSGVLCKRTEDLFKDKESVVRRGVVDLDSEVIVKSETKDPGSPPVTKNEPPSQQETKKQSTGQFDFDILGNDEPAKQSTPTAKLSTPGKMAPPPGKIKPVEKEVNLLDLDFDTSSPGTQQTTFNQEVPVKASNKQPQQIEENLFEDDQQEEDLFEGADDLIEQKFISMPEEVVSPKSRPY